MSAEMGLNQCIKILDEPLQMSLSSGGGLST
jgi:hypothetical protein